MIGGAPGSGKSTLAKVIKDGYVNLVRVSHLETDNYFIKQDGTYGFEQGLLKHAHQWCQDKVSDCMAMFDPVIIVSNTFTKAWERRPYLEMARKRGYTVQYIYCTGQFQNIHGVPQAVIDRMRDQYEPFDPAKEL